MDAWDDLKKACMTGKSVPEIIDAFEVMCQIPIEDDLVFFETGTYSFTGEPLFYFCLVRQYPNADGEFSQMRIEVTFMPDSENCALSDEIWSDEREVSNLFDSIRKTESFAYAVQHPYRAVEIRMEET